MLKNLLRRDKNLFRELYSYLKFVVEYSIKDTSQFETLGKIYKNEYKNLIITYSNSENLKKKKIIR